jgi:uncharacterized membrane protein YgdD (TMEM256/DUF423 family)
MLTILKKRRHELLNDVYPLGGLTLLAGYLLWAAAG